MVIAAEQLQAGDIVDYGGARHVVVEIRRPSGAAWPMPSIRIAGPSPSVRSSSSLSAGRSPRSSQPDRRTPA